MIKSMTGFGRSEVSDGDRKITVEMKSVNHRYFEPSVKMPKKLNFYEAAIRDELKNYISRGKVDIFISYEDYAENRICLKYNEELAEEYMGIFARMSEHFGIDNDIRVSLLSRYPEVITMEEQNEDEEELWLLLKSAIDKACEQFVDARIYEGEKLKEDISGKLDYITELVDRIEERSPETVREYREKLTDKIYEVLEDPGIDENRIATEVTIFADKICVDEETVRLKSHISSMNNELMQGGSVGRKLDFIAQEMNREANTILSKANNIDISGWAISLKTEIEKVREQIQNIE